MPEEPKIDVEDLPKDESKLDEKDLDAASGGLRRIVSIPPKANFGLRRMSDPCEGEQLT